MRLKKPLTYLLIFSILTLTGCDGSENSSETKRYIEQVRASTKPNTEIETSSLTAPPSPPITDISTIRKRNPFDAQAIAATAEGAVQKAGKLELVGIFYINQKKWAIIHVDGKIHRVVAGDKLGPNRVVTKITDNSVTIVQDDNGEQQTFTLTLQEHK